MQTLAPRMEAVQNDDSARTCETTEHADHTREGGLLTSALSPRKQFPVFEQNGEMPGEGSVRFSCSQSEAGA